VPDNPSASTVDLLEVSTRVGQARPIVAGFSRAVPALTELWQQIDDALSDMPALTAEVARLRDELTSLRLHRANLAAAGWAAIAAYLHGEPDPLGYLRDELTVQGFGMERGQA
jgi:hypothetical protein